VGGGVWWWAVESAEQCGAVGGVIMHGFGIKRRRRNPVLLGVDGWVVVKGLCVDAPGVRVVCGGGGGVED
jgi:hypothetical protein